MKIEVDSFKITQCTCNIILFFKIKFKLAFESFEQNYYLCLAFSATI